MDENSLKVLLARGLSVEQIGRRFQRDPSTVAYWMRKYGLVAPNRETYAPKGGIDRDVLEGLVDEGSSIAEITEVLGLSNGTVRHWLRRYGLVTRGKVRSQQSKLARDVAMLQIRRECAVHGVADFIIEGRGYYRCKRCRQERVARHRRDLKQTLVREAGGACVVCGYDRHLGRCNSTTSIRARSGWRSTVPEPPSRWRLCVWRRPNAWSCAPTAMRRSKAASPRCR